MPKRSAVGTNLGVFSRFVSRARTARREKVQSEKQSVLIETLENRVLLSRSWFVAPWGNDGGAGTLASPFRTIQTAANWANWGDAVQIEAGTYHETIKPPHSGVTF